MMRTRRRAGQGLGAERILVPPGSRLTNCTHPSLLHCIELWHLTCLIHIRLMWGGGIASDEYLWQVLFSGAGRCARQCRLPASSFGIQSQHKMYLVHSDLRPRFVITKQYTSHVHSSNWNRTVQYGFVLNVLLGIHFYVGDTWKQGRCLDDWLWCRPKKIVSEIFQHNVRCGGA